MEKIGRFVEKYRVFIIIITLMITLVASFLSLKLRIESDVVKYLPQNDPVVKLFDRQGAMFGSDYVIMIGIRAEDVFDHRTLEEIKNITDNIESFDGVLHITSLTNILDVRESADGIEINNLIDNVPVRKAALDSIRTYVLSKKIYRGTIVSPDGKSTVIIVKLDSKANKVKIVSAIRQYMKEGHFEFKYFLGGMPVQMQELQKLIIHDLKTLIPLVVFAIFLVISLFFMDIGAALTSLASVGIASLCTLGLLPVLHKPLTMISEIIPVVLVSVGIAYPIHIIHALKYREGKIAHALSDVGASAFMAALTTMVGFISFIFGSYLPIIKDFGIFSAIGVFISFVLAVLFVPSVYRTKLKVNIGKNVAHSTVLLLKDPDNIFTRRIYILAGIILFALGIWGSTKLTINSNIIKYFKKSSEVRVTTDFLDRTFGGSNPLDIIVSGDMHNPYVLKEIFYMEKYLSSLKSVNNTRSISDLMARMNYIMEKKKSVPDSRAKVENLYFLIEGEEITSQLVNSDANTGLLVGMVGMHGSKLASKLVDSVNSYIERFGDSLYVFKMDKSTDVMLWQARAKLVSNLITDDIKYYDYPLHSICKLSDTLFEYRGEGDVNKLFGWIESAFPDSALSNKSFVEDIKGDISEYTYKTAVFPKKVLAGINAVPEKALKITVRQTGYPVVYKKLNDSLLLSLLLSMGLALLFVFILLSIEFKSVQGGLLGLIPIVITIAFVLGLMGFFSIPIDVATVLVVSIAIGIGIDYTIHFLKRLSLEAKKTDNISESIAKTLKTTGNAILINALSVSAGFITLILSQLIPIERFGLLIAATMIVSGFLALTFVPALIIEVGAVSVIVKNLTHKKEALK